MAVSTIWAIDVGHNALRAVKARRLGDRVQVLSFDVVEYRQNLATPGVDRDVQIQQAVHTFVARNDLRGCGVAVVIPAPSALVRFIQLPPVDRSAIPDIVQYEARQQIPFPLEEVCWDHAAIDRGFIPGEQVEVGLFALRKEIAFALLNCLRVGGIDPDLMQIPHVALFNFVNFERPPGREAVLVMDMGVENTHLLCLSEDTVWTRSLPIAANTFTQAIQKALGISYEEAEQEKRNARKSPRAKEIAEAIAQPMSRFIEEVQRSLGYFRSLHPETRVASILALGQGFKLPGLARYVQEAAGVEIHGLSSLENFDLSQARNLNHFRQHVVSFPVALGLAAQVLGIPGTLDTTMLPPEVLRQKVLARKKPYAATAAVVVLALVGVLFGAQRAVNGRLRQLKGTQVSQADSEVEKVESLRRRLAVSVDDELKFMGQVKAVFKDRGLWLRVLDELKKPLPPEPQNKTLWLTAIGSSYVPLVQVAASLVELPPELAAGGPERMRGPQGRGMRLGALGEPMVVGRRGREAVVVPEPVLRVVVMGEAKHPERESYVDQAFVSELNKSDLFSYVSIVYADTVRKWVDSSGRVVALVAETRGPGVRPTAPEAPPAAGGAPTAPEELRQEEYTQFVVQVFVDPEGKLPKAVAEQKRLMQISLSAPQFQP